MADNGIALLCMLHPESPAKQDRLLHLLREGAREYYTQPSAACTTWSYFTPFPPPKPGKPSSRPPVIGGLELYTRKSALQTQLDDKAFFQAFQAKAQREALYARPEELGAWYLTGGWVSRAAAGSARPFGNVVISLSRFDYEDREAVLAQHMKPFAQWVQDNEPGVLTYAIFTRPKAPHEVLLFVRYKDTAALKYHDTHPEHRKVVRTLSGLVTNDMKTSTTLWLEVPDSFVGEQVGGPKL